MLDVLSNRLDTARFITLIQFMCLCTGENTIADIAKRG
jgi:hypothetical protein